MGNACECVSRQTDDDAEDALLAPEFQGDQPRGPPPPYQPRAPLYAYTQMTEEQRIQLVQRLTLIQCLPCGRYADAREEKKSPELEEEVSPQPSSSHGEKKGDKDRECPICMMDFMVGQPIRLLPCMHYYHMRCIDDWLMRSLTCPTCMERVDVGVRNTVISSHSLRRRRVGSSSSTASTVSSGSNSSTEHLLNYSQGPQLQLHTSPSPGQRQRNRNGTQQVQPQSPVHVQVQPNPLTLNLEQVNACNANGGVGEVHPSRGTLLCGLSPPGSPLLAVAAGGTRRRHREVAPRSPTSPPLIEYHYEYLPTSPTSTNGTKSSSGH